MHERSTVNTVHSIASQLQALENRLDLSKGGVGHPAASQAGLNFAALVTLVTAVVCLMYLHVTSFSAGKSPIS